MKFCCALYQWVSGSFARAQRTQALLADGRREKGKGLNLRPDELHNFRGERGRIASEWKSRKRW